MTRSRRVPAFAPALALLSAAALAQGLSTHRAQMWDQGLLQVPDPPEADDRLGAALAAGDFDGDGFTDLAIGIPTEDLVFAGNGVQDAGAVVVLHGGPTGLDLARAQFWTQDTPGVADYVEPFDHFGEALAAGDFNGDGYRDLAIGVPWEGMEAQPRAGAVNVLYGSAAGLTATGDQFWSQADPLVLGEADLSEDFGGTLVAGDFDGDGYQDLAIGAPEDGWDPQFSHDGGVNVLFGSVVGLTADGDQYFRGRDFPGTAEDGALLGSALAAGDFDDDGFEDLAVGAWGDDFVDVLNAGSVRVFFGSPAGLTTDRDLYLLGPDAEAEFGAALAAGDIDGDGDADLAIGVPGRRVGGDASAGSVQLRLGDGGQFLDGGEWTQDTAGVQGIAEGGDAFGASLDGGDFDLDGRADLAVGVPSEDLGEADEGAVHVLFGAAGGLTASRNQLWLRDDLPLADPSAADHDDLFGRSLAAGDFDGSGHADLAIGSPGEALTTAGAAGAVYALHGSLFADGFASEDTSAWSATVP